MISVIVPVYNTAEQLLKCIESILNQTYEDIELILIDDGSTDGSETIVDKYAAKDSRIKIVHQENQGESAARNKGLELATGDIITFVDCDDWIEPNMYELLINEMSEYNLDIAACGWSKDYDDKILPAINKLPVPEGVLDRNQTLKCIYMRDSYQGFAFMWDKLYKRKVLTDNNEDLFKFDTSMKIGGDVLYLARVALNANRTRYIDKPSYHYYQRNNSGMHALSSQKMKDWISAYYKVLELMGNENVPDEIIGYIKRFIAYHASNAVEIAVRENNTVDKEYFQKVMKENENEYINLNKEYPDRIERYLKLKKK